MSRLLKPKSISFPEFQESIRLASPERGYSFREMGLDIHGQPGWYEARPQGVIVEYFLGSPAPWIVNGWRVASVNFESADNFNTCPSLMDKVANPNPQWEPYQG